MLFQAAFGDAGEFIDVMSEWPEAFCGIGKGFKVEQFEDIECESLSCSREALMIAEESGPDMQSVNGALCAELGSLKRRERLVLSEMFLNQKSTAEIAKKLGVTQSRVHSIKNDALRHLRRPASIERLSEILEEIV